MLKIRAFSGQLAAGLGAVAVIFTGSTFLNSSVISFRLRELDQALETATRQYNQNRNLGMLIQYELLKRRLEDEENESDFATEAQLQAFLSEREAESRVAFENFLDPVAFAAIRSVRFLTGKTTELRHFNWAPGPNLRIAYYHERSRRYRKAIHWYEASLENEERLRGEILLHMGFCYSLLNQYEKAYWLFQYVCDTFPGEDEAAAAAKLYQELKLLDRSIRHAVSRAKGTTDPLAVGRNLYRSMRYHEALNMLSDVAERAGSQRPARVQEAWYLAGRCYEAVGRDTLAVQLYRILTASYPKTPWAKKAYQRLLLVHTVYAPDQREAQEVSKVMKEEYLADDYVKEVLTSAQQVASVSIPEPLSVPPPAVVPAEIPILETNSEEREAVAVEDSIIQATSHVFSRPLDVKETQSERRKRKREWEKEQQRRLAKRRKAEKEKQQRREAERKLSEQFKNAAQVADDERGKKLPVPDYDTLPAFNRGVSKEPVPMGAVEVHALRDHFSKLEQQLKKNRDSQRRIDKEALAQARNRKIQSKAAVLSTYSEAVLEDRTMPADAAQLQLAKLEKQRKKRTYYIVTNDSVVLADAPVQGKRIDLLYAGDLLKYVSSKSGALRVSASSGQRGWVPSQAAAQQTSLAGSRVRELKARGRKLRADAQTIRALKFRSQASIRTSIGNHLPNVNLVYKKTLKIHPDVKGTVQVRFCVNPSGKVVSAEVRSSDIRQKDFIADLLHYVRTIRFKTIPEDIGEMTFVFPFEFNVE